MSDSPLLAREMTIDYSIEQIESLYSGLPPAVENSWNVFCIEENRFYLSRDEEGRYVSFLIGDRDSFGPVSRAFGIEFSDAVYALPEGVTLTAAKLRARSRTFSRRIMAHVAFELQRRLRERPGVDNRTLLSEVRWILELLGDRDDILTSEQQIGLLGELILLRKLLAISAENSWPARSALDVWCGFDGSKRDFAGNKVAIEVKVTSASTRVHQISSISQLDIHGPEDVYLFSVGIRADSSAPRKLPDFIADVENLLIDASGNRDHDLVGEFHDGLRLYGYDSASVNIYNSGPGFLNFHLRPALFRECDLDRLRMSSFKEDKLPSMVAGVSYSLAVTSQEVTETEEREILLKLLVHES